MRKRLSIFLLGIFVSSLASAQMHDHGATASGDGQFNPFIVSDNHGGFYVSYVERKAGVSNVMIQHSTASGGFANGLRVNNRPGDGAVRNENPPKIAVGPNGDVYVVWANERERWKGNIRFARSVNGGRTFEPAMDLNSDGSAAPASRALNPLRWMRTDGFSSHGSMNATKRIAIAALKSGWQYRKTTAGRFRETERSCPASANAAGRLWPSIQWDGFF